MTGETDLSILLKTMKPKLNIGEFVFCTTDQLADIPFDKVVLFFNEESSYTIVLTKELADKLSFRYSFIASWITLTMHSSLEAVGLTAAFSKALSEHNISCNVVAAFYHDHIFVPAKDTENAMRVLNDLARSII